MRRLLFSMLVLCAWQLAPAQEVVLQSQRLSEHCWFFQGESGMASLANFRSSENLRIHPHKYAKTLKRGIVPASRLEADGVGAFDLNIEGFSALASVLRLAEDSLIGRTHPVIGRERFAFGPE